MKLGMSGTGRYLRRLPFIVPVAYAVDAYRSGCLTMERENPFHLGRYRMSRRPE